MPESKVSMSSLYGPVLLLLSVYKIKEEYKLYKQLGMFFRQTGMAWHSLEQQVLHVYCVRYTKRLALEQDQALLDCWAAMGKVPSYFLLRRSELQSRYNSVHQQELTEHTSPSDSSFVCLEREGDKHKTHKRSKWLTGHIWYSRMEIFISHTSFFFPEQVKDNYF